MPKVSGTRCGRDKRQNVGPAYQSADDVAALRGKHGCHGSAARRVHWAKGNIMDKHLDTSWWTLRLTYGLVPIVAGADKFTNLLVDWKQYLSPMAAHLPVSASTLMMIIGVIEILAGAIVLSRHTRLGAYVVAAWLVGIALNLVQHRKYFEDAVR